MAVYPSALLALGAGTLNWDTNTIRALLVNGSASYNRTHDTVSDITANELSQATRVDLVTSAPADNGTTRIIFDATDIVFNSQTSGQTVGACIIYKFITNDAGSLLIAFVDGTNITTDGSNITVTFPADGVFGLDYA